MAALRNVTALQSVLVAAKLDPTGVRFARAWHADDIPGLSREPKDRPQWIAYLPGDTVPVPLGMTIEAALRDAPALLRDRLPFLNGKVWGACPPPKESPQEVARRAEQAKLAQRQRDRQEREARERARQKEKLAKEAEKRAIKIDRLAAEARAKAPPQPRRRRQIESEETS